MALLYSFPILAAGGSFASISGICVLSQFLRKVAFHRGSLGVSGLTSLSNFYELAASEALPWFLQRILPVWLGPGSYFNFTAGVAQPRLFDVIVYCWCWLASVAIPYVVYTAGVALPQSLACVQSRFRMHN